MEKELKNTFWAESNNVWLLYLSCLLYRFSGGEEKWVCTFKVQATAWKENLTKMSVLLWTLLPQRRNPSAQCEECGSTALWQPFMSSHDRAKSPHLFLSSPRSYYFRHSGLIGTVEFVIHTNKPQNWCVCWPIKLPNSPKPTEAKNWYLLRTYDALASTHNLIHKSSGDEWPMAAYQGVTGHSSERQSWG